MTLRTHIIDVSSLADTSQDAPPVEGASLLHWHNLPSLHEAAVARLPPRLLFSFVLS
ncbi:hypothetical protein ACFL4U_01930 [Candidatus Neomarinimicrobiota bacterium]